MGSACRVMRDENLRLASKMLARDKGGQSRPQKPSVWVVDQREDFLSASSGPSALIKEEWEADTFSPGLKAVVS